MLHFAYISSPADFHSEAQLDTGTIWAKFHAGIQPYQLYSDTRVIDDVVKDLQTATIERTGEE